MADIISKLNLTEEELKNNKRELEEIVRLIDVIESSNGFKGFNTYGIENNLVKLAGNLKKNFNDKWIDGLLGKVQYLSKELNIHDSYIKMNRFLNDKQQLGTKFIQPNKDFLSNKPVDTMLNNVPFGAKSVESMSEFLVDYSNKLKNSRFRELELDAASHYPDSLYKMSNAQFTDFYGGVPDDYGVVNTIKELKTETQKAAEPIKEVKTQIDSLKDSEVEAAAEAANLFAKLQGVNASSLKQTADDIKQIADEVKSVNKPDGLGKLLHSFGIKGFNHTNDEDVFKFIGIADILKRSKLGVDETLKKINEYANNSQSEAVKNAIGNLKNETIEKLKRFEEIDKILDTPEMRRLFGYKEREKGSKIYSNNISNKLFAEYTKKYNEGAIDKDKYPELFNRIDILKNKLNTKKYSKALDLSSFFNNSFKVQSDKVTEAVKSAQKPIEDVVKQVNKNIVDNVNNTAKQVASTVAKTVSFIQAAVKAGTIIQGGSLNPLQGTYLGNGFVMGGNKSQASISSRMPENNKYLPAVQGTSEIVEASYIKNIVNTITNEIGSKIQDQFKKTYGIVPVGSPYTKGDNFRIYDETYDSNKTKFTNRNIDYHNDNGYTFQAPALRPGAGLATMPRSTESYAEDAYNNNILDSLYANASKNRERVLREEQSINARIIREAQADAAKVQADAAKAQADAQKQWEDTLNSIRSKIKTVVDDIKQSIATVIKVVRMANDVLHKTAMGIISAFQTAGGAIKKLISLFGNLADRVKQTDKHTNTLRYTYTELYHMVRLLSGAFNKIFNNSFINQGKELLSAIQSLNMIIGSELTQETIGWAEKLEYAFGLSAAELISNLKQVSAILYGLGMNSKNVAIAGKNLETVGMQLSVVTGYDYSTVMSKIQSGLKGMTQSVDDLGISVRETQMNAFLKKLKAQGGEYANISTKFENLTEQQRIYVRYAAIMDQITSRSAYSAENYAKSLETITGKISILKSQINALKSSIGVLALKLFEKIVMPLTYIIYLINQLVKKIADVLGIDISLKADMNGGEPQEAIDDTTDSLNDMNEAANDAKGALDDLDHVSTMSKNGSAGDQFDYSKLMDLAGDYSDILSDMEDANNNYIEKCKEAFERLIANLKNKFTDLIKKLTGRDIDWGFIKGNLEKTWNNIKETFKNIWKAIKNFGKIVLGLIWSIGDDLDFSTLLEKFTRVIKLATYLVQKILEKVQPYIQKFYDKYLSPYVKKFGDWCEKYLDKAIVKLSEWIAWWENDGNNPKIQEWFDGLGEKFENLVKWLSYIKTLFKGLFGMKKNKTDVLNLKEMPDWLKNIYDIMVDVNSIFNDFKDILKDTSVHILDLNGDGQLTFEDVKLAIEKIKEKLDEVAQWVNDNKENISLVLNSAWDTLSKLAELKFSIIEQLIKLVVENADKVSAVLRTICDIIDNVKKNPVLAMAISIGGLTLGKIGLGVGKALITTWMWKKLLGLGPGGAAAKAAAEGGKLITSTLTSNMATPGTLGSLPGGAGGAAAKTATGLTLGGTFIGIGAIGTAAAVTIKGVAEGVNTLIDGVEDVEGIVTKVNEETGETFRITARNTQTYAYNIRRALTEVYGKDSDRSKLERAFKLYAEDLQQTLNLTDEETEYVRRNIERQYKRTESVFGNALDDISATAAYSTDNSANNIKKLAETFRQLDTQTGESTSKLNNNLDNVAKKSEEVKGKVTTNWDGIRGVYTTTADTIKKSTDEINNQTEAVKTKTDELKNKVTTNWDGIRGVYTTTTNSTNESLNKLNENNEKTWDEILKETYNASEEIKTNTSDIKFNIEEMCKSINESIPQIQSFTSRFISEFSNLNNQIYLICSNINTQINNMFQQVITQANNANDIAQQINNNRANTNWNPNYVRTFGFANGGVPNSGSLFFANENGNTELVGNFGGYSGVANQDMIIQAMQGAMVQAIRSAGGFNSNQKGNITINVGNWLGDEAGIRKLANKINSVNVKSNSNIANVSFSMS